VAREITALPPIMGVLQALEAGAVSVLLPKQGYDAGGKTAFMPAPADAMGAAS